LPWFLYATYFVEDFFAASLLLTLHNECLPYLFMPEADPPPAENVLITASVYLTDQSLNIKLSDQKILSINGSTGKET